ncbi:sulfotransferase [Fodinibius salsisoli]|uniref:Sulfotransferase family protein n=1 Tax=Fodinibius salsisoli TaxID=2820877 RepID=A0ABT3PTF1_9BACT|nr:sulfotransferase [Fodinibius salsisoli]MCW9709138.1 hypothetical protein [Fodinibius salsisoli]
MIEIIKDKLLKRVKGRVKKSISRFQSIGRQKVFGIGNNKTGTTSLEAAMERLGFVVGDQITDIQYTRDWGQRDFESLIKYCKYGQFFQDNPFSKPFTFIVLDHEFPNSKFILTVRDNPEQWYNSLIKFHAKLWGKDGRIPNKEDLINDTKFYKGYRWEKNRIHFNTPIDDLYNKDILIESYKRHNKNVRDYFRHRPDDLLVLNVANDGSYQKLCDFLDVKSEWQDFPWKNKTKEVKQ